MTYYTFDISVYGTWSQACCCICQEIRRFLPSLLLPTIHSRSSIPIPLDTTVIEIEYGCCYVPLSEPSVCFSAGLGPRQRKRKMQRLGLQEDGQNISRDTTPASLSEATEDELGSTSLADGQSTSASAKDVTSCGEEAEDTAEEAANRSVRGNGMSAKGCGTSDRGRGDKSAEEPAGRASGVGTSYEAAGGLDDGISKGLWREHALHRAVLAGNQSLAIWHMGGRWWQL